MRWEAKGGGGNLQIVTMEEVFKGVGNFGECEPHHLHGGNGISQVNYELINGKEDIIISKDGHT